MTMAKESDGSFEFEENINDASEELFDQIYAALKIEVRK